MSILTIGNFDGCHLGHQALISRTLQVAHTSLDETPAALTFSPRPEAFFKGISKEALLMTMGQKQRALAELGILEFHCLDFDKQLASMSAKDFLDKVILKRFHGRHLVIGEDFHFGQNRVGHAAWLLQHTDPKKFGVSVVKTYQVKNQKIGSSLIRSLLGMYGDVATAQEMLGRPYLLEGVITKGQQLGRTIGFPTINLQTTDQLIPKPGVYAGYLWLESPTQGTPTILTRDPTARRAVFNIGYKPTVAANAGAQISVEGHILEEHPVLKTLAHKETYGLKAGFYMCHRLRDEQKFSSLEELKKQINKDCTQGLELLNSSVI